LRFIEFLPTNSRLAADHDFGDRCKDVVGRADADENNPDGENSPRGIKWFDLLIADGRDGDDRHVERVEEWHPLDHHVAGAA
jgi:hypothetical protein